MHACKGGLAGQAFVLAAANDSGGRKSRIRRSKEERKSMVESFINKYQKSNNGTFPSLNLTHKEVGGSFYTVREIVREIIQENRVLAPPKGSFEENGHSGFLEQHPVGSISMEPQIDLSESERVHMVTHILPDKYQLSSEENISSSNGSYPLELGNEQIINGLSKVAAVGKGSDRASESHHAHYQGTSIEEVSKTPVPESHEFEDEKSVNGSEVLDGSPRSNKPLVTNSDHQENIDSARLFTEKINGLGSDEQYQKKADEFVDKTEVGVKNYTEALGMETLDKERVEAENRVTSQSLKSHMITDVVVETFPLRPVGRMIHETDGESGKLQETGGILEDKTIPKAFTQSPCDFVDEKLPDSTMGSIDKKGDEKVVVGESALENSVLVESKVSLADATKASSDTETLISEGSIEVQRKSNDQDNSSNRTLDRINLETWEGASKKSSNPLLALVKAFISSFVKFWTE